MEKGREGRSVKTEKLKKWAQASLPVDSNLRELLMLERDEIGAEEFIIKIDVWLKLLELETPTSE